MLCMEICIHSGRFWGGRGRCREFPCSVVPAFADIMTCFPPPITPLILLSAPERLSGSKAELGQGGIRMFMLLMVSYPVPPGLARVFLPGHPELLRPGLVEGIPPLVLLLLGGCFPLSGVGEKRFQPLWWLLGWSASAILLPHSLALQADTWLFPAQSSSRPEEERFFFSRRWIIKNVHALLSHWKIFKPAACALWNTGKM